MTKEDMEAYKQLNKELPDPFPANKVEGPKRTNQVSRIHGRLMAMSVMLAIFQSGISLHD